MQTTESHRYKSAPGPNSKLERDTKSAKLGSRRIERKTAAAACRWARNREGERVGDPALKACAAPKTKHER